MLAAAIAAPGSPSGPPGRDDAYQHIKSRYFSSLRLNPADANKRNSLDPAGAAAQTREWPRRRSRTLENAQPPLPPGSSAVKIEKSTSRDDMFTPFAMSMPPSAALLSQTTGVSQTYAGRGALEQRPLDASWDDDPDQSEDSDPEIVTSTPIAIPSQADPAADAQTARSTARTLAPRRFLQEKGNFEMQQKRKQERLRVLAEQLE